MNLREFQPNLWLTELTLDGYDVRGTVIVGDEYVLVWDTLTHPHDMYAVASLAGEKPIYVIYSHADWDHCWGTAGLRTTLIIAQDSCVQRFQKVRGGVAETLLRKQGEAPGLWDAVKLVPPNLAFSHSLTLYLGNLTVELHHLPGHTEDCLVAFIPALGVFLAGDTVETPLPHVKETSVELLPQWITELERWEEDNRVQVVIPAHGDIGGRTQIALNLRYLRDLCDGKAPDVPARMTPFYSEMHTKNQEVVRSRNKLRLLRR